MTITGLATITGLNSITYGTVSNTYATWNPADKASGVTLSGANLITTFTSTKNAVRATIGKSSGKWYWEILVNTLGDGVAGIGNISADLTSGLSYMGDVNGWGYLLALGNIATNNSYSGFGNALVNGNILGVALNMNTGTISFYINNVLQGGGPAYTGITGTIYPITSSFNDTASNFTANFGATTMAYTAPSGYNQGLYN
jgi:hypothetical protein